MSAQTYCPNCDIVYPMAHKYCPLCMLKQVSGELCDKCGWAMRFPQEPCRCELEEENAELRKSLRWYVENDDTNQSEYNKSWLDGKRRAMVVLDMEVDDD
jgi:methionyl-tRNA synthetase